MSYQDKSVFTKPGDHDKDKTIGKEKNELQAEIGKVETRWEIPFDHFGTKTEKHVHSKDQERDAEIGKKQGNIFDRRVPGFQIDQNFPDDPGTCHTINAKDV